MSAPIAADGRWAVGTPDNRVRADTRISGHVEPGGSRRPRHTVAGLLDDAWILLLVIWLFPLAILLIGMPVALLVRLLIEIVPGM